MGASDSTANSPGSARVRFENLVPFTDRATLHYDLRSAPLYGACLGVMTLLPWVVKETFGGSAWEVAVLSAAPPMGHLLDLYWAHHCTHRRKMPWVVWPGMISRLLIILVGVAVNSSMVVLFGVLSYIVGSVAVPAVSSILRTNYPGTRRYRVVGVVMGLSSLTMALVAGGAGLLLRYAGDDKLLFRPIFIIGGVLGMLGVWVYSRIKVRGERHLAHADPVPAGRFSFFRDIGLLWRRPKFGKYQLIQFTSGFANIMTLPALVELLKYQDVGWLAAAIVLGVAPNLTRALSMPFYGRLLQKLNPMQARAIFSVFWTTAYVLIALSGLQVAWVVAARLIMGLAHGATMLLWTLQQMYFARKRDVPKFMGVHCTLTGLRGLIAPFFGAWLMYRLNSQHAVFGLSALLAAAAGYLSLRLAVHEKRTTNHTGHVDGGGVEE